MGADLSSRPVDQGNGVLHDVLIVGGGPAGSSAALYAARSGLETLIVDKGVATGALAAAARIENYPGLAEVTSGIALLERMRGQAARFGARFVEDRVLIAALDAEEKEARGIQGTYRGRALIVATGSMGRAKTIPGEERLAGRGVSYCATCDGFFFRDQVVAVVGGTAEAVEESLFLAGQVKAIHVLVPARDLKAPPALVERLSREKRVHIHYDARVREVVGGKTVEGVRVATEEGEEVLPVAAAFIYLQGALPITDFLQGALPTAEDGGLFAEAGQTTARPGVFVAGDVVHGALRQVIHAAASGAAAAVSARHYLSETRARDA